MREIRFRGKTAYGNWVVGSLSINDVGDYFIESYNKIGIRNTVLVTPATVGQFTGLLDRNGTEIYEGDVIQVRRDNDRYKCRNISSSIGDVRWNEVSMCWYAKGQIWTTLSAADAFFDIEVIGNIHDNPEQLGDNVSGLTPYKV